MIELEITKETFDTFIILYQQLNECICKRFRQFSIASNLYENDQHHCSSWEYDQFTKGCFLVYWEERWQYGGYDSGSMYMPAEYVYMSDDKFDIEMLSVHAEVVEHDRLSKLKRQEQQQQDDLKKYQELKSKLKI